MTNDIKLQIRNKAILSGFFDESTSEWEYTFCGAFLLKYQKRDSILKLISEAIGVVPTWESITDRNLKKFKALAETRMCASSLKVTFARIKSVLNDNKNEVEIPSKRYAEILQVRKEASQAVYLTEKEVERFAQYEPNDSTERFAQAIFLISCYTGCRHSDAIKMTSANIQESTITYVSQKTRTKVSLPVHSNLLQFLNVGKMEMYDCDYNNIVRTICKSIGVTERLTIYRRGKEETGEKWQFISSHTARRSFCTNLYLRGADLLTIARLAGHSSPEITKNYIVGYRDISDDVMSFFS